MDYRQNAPSCDPLSNQKQWKYVDIKSVELNVNELTF